MLYGYVPRYTDIHSCLYINVLFVFQHFVSDRKVDDDLARTTRFLYDDDKMVAATKVFGEGIDYFFPQIQRILFQNHGSTLER